MSVSHLQALEDALTRRGWRISVRPGDDSRISATWELRRGRGESLLLDFDGMGPDGRECLPLEQSYGCQVRGHPTLELYFRRINRSRHLWQQELAEFTRSLDAALA